ncbi:MAG: prepilin-type N-terminal cleavage/methylation domain-containing protein [Patescibacteria group bacterium]|nr:prepilin-type N-terminal cleavage/methylation domain-containing protein [Patescibacteria group bacterium]
MAKIKSFIKKLIKKIKKNNRGFSLTELMVSVSIIGSIATLAGAQMDDILPLARDAQRKANIHQVQTALNLYYDDHGQYPITASNEPSVAGWQSIVPILESADQMYVPEMPRDPLDTGEYVFKYWSDGQKFKIAYETEDQTDKSPQIAWGL